MDTHPRDSDGWIETMRVRLTEDFEAQSAHLRRLEADGTDPEEAHTHDALLAATRESLEQTREALRRVNDGSYGDCGRCDRAIPRERLEVLPHARYCVPCQERR